MEHKSITEEVKMAVEAIFSEKAESEMRKKTEEELAKAAETIKSLTEALEAKEAEVSALSIEVSSEKDKTTGLGSELEAARQELEVVKAKVVETEGMLENIKKDRIAEARMSELEISGVLTSNKEAQTQKIRDMSDEVFIAYKTELEDIRASVESKVKEAVKKEAATAEEAVKKAAEAEKASEGVVTPPPNVTPEQKAKAALDLEVGSDDIVSKYKRFGQTMAAAIKK